jgi:opacity protein-like surface antigen
MKIKVLVIAALLLALGAATSPVLAQNRSESWEFGPYLVYFGFDGATEIQDDWGGGFRVGYNFVPMHELEFAFEQVDTQDNVSHDIDVRVRQFQTNYNFNFIFDRHQTVIPYFTAGLGAIKFNVQQTIAVPGGLAVVSGEETDPTFSFGGGVRFFFDKKFNLRLDGRFVSYTGNNDVLRDVYFTNSQFSVGVGWVLGGR